MGKFVDITGQRFNKLVVIRRVENAKNGGVRWECVCDCGNTKVVSGGNLKSGAVKSCGCLHKISIPSTHRMSKTRLYREWAAIKNRCCNPNSSSYKDYGSRGINICEEWKNSFETFRDWALTHGYSDDLTIERKNSDSDYCPENCTWIPFNEQQKNRRICYSITFRGETKNLTEWCRTLDLPYPIIHNRINKLGWPYERALTEPVHIEKRNKTNGRIRTECVSNDTAKSASPVKYLNRM